MSAQDPATTRRVRLLAALTLAGFAFAYVGFQMAASAAGASWEHEIQGGEDMHSQWRNFVDQRPEVLFIGDSRTRFDVQAVGVARQLSALMGRQVRVGKIGITNGKPGTLAAVMYRLSIAPHKPRVVLWNMSEYAFNENFFWTPHHDYFVLNDPVDPRYMVWASLHDVNPGLMTQDFLAPAEEYSPELVAGAICVRTSIADWFRSQAWIQFIRPSPKPDYCHVKPDVDGMVDFVATPESFAESARRYRGYFVDNWKYSTNQAALLREGLRDATGAGIHVVVWIPPVYHLDVLAPSIYSQFLTGVREAAAADSVPVSDLHDLLVSRPQVFFDAGHLNRMGATALAPTLANLAYAAEAG